MIELVNGDPASEMMTIDELATMVKQQADRLFPNRTDTSMYLKMFKEMGELIEDGDPEEVADVLIMVLDFAARKQMSIQDVIMSKMTINENRTWKVNALGVMSHVK